MEVRTSVSSFQSVRTGGNHTLPKFGTPSSEIEAPTVIDG
jgi:hypothetical protein